MKKMLPGTMIGALSLLVIRGLELRLPQITRGFWEDEAHHNYPVLAATGLWDLQARLWSQFQPMLDFFLRKYFWFPLFGRDEISMRIPSLFFSLMTIFAAYLITLRHFKRNGLSPWISLTFACLAGAWISRHGIEVSYSVEARHYSLVSLVSLLWCSIVLIVPRASERALALSSLIFANTHFFSLPLIVGAYGLRALDDLRIKNGIKATRQIATLAAICLATAYLNKPAFGALLNGPPSGTVSPWTQSRLLEVTAAGWGLWLSYLSYLGLSVHHWLLGLILIFGIFVFDHKRIMRLLVLLCLVTPAFLIYCRARSGYGFGDRYFSPFFGLGFAVLILSLESILGGLKHTSRLVRLHSSLWTKQIDEKMPKILTALTSIVLTFGLFTFARETWANRETIRAIPRNFSSYYLAYQEIRAMELPVFVLHSHCYANDIPSLYFEFIGGAYSKPNFMRDSRGCDFNAAQVRADLQSFIKTYPLGVIVLDQKEQDCSPAEPLFIRSQAKVGHLSSVKNCFWTLQNATSIEDVFELAQAAKFIFEKDLFISPEVRPSL